jgi:hypothetical protein
VKPTQLGGVLAGCSKQYRKAIEASFPPDRWPPSEVLGPGPLIRYVLKDWTEIHRVALEPIYDGETNLPIFENGKQLFTDPYGKKILVNLADAIARIANA